MGIYIENMKVPESCVKCPLSKLCVVIYDGDTRSRFSYYCEVDNMEIDELPIDFNKRRPDCPLVKVPKHGRLIDADKVLSRHGISAFAADCTGCIFEDKKSCIALDRKILCEAITNAPTVIPAEPPKEEK